MDTPSQKVPAVVYMFLVLGTLFIFGMVTSALYFAQLVAIADVSPTEEIAPTNFAESGRLRLATSTERAYSFEFIYAPAGKATTTQPLIFDVQSLCSASNGTLPCMAMSATYDLAFGSRQLVIEGVQDEKGVTIRRLRAYEPGEPITIPRIGLFYVDWPQVVSAFESCDVKSVMTHLDNTVELFFWGNDRVWISLQPLQGDLERTLDRVGDSCSPISRLTQ